ncbi:MAG: tRNA epoxyqueuosine(34) reductase QueG [Acidobacteria bacterium]|nr:tRNA epoxyqueuosine(34) reductase QueG [Acidobacteriota bacterium]
MLTPSHLSALAKQAARDAGFELAGVAPVGEDTLRELAYFPEWIAAGRAGEMEYLKARDEQGRLKRAALRHAAPWARSVVVCALNYNTGAPYSTECLDPARGWISRYAWGYGKKSGNESSADYHDVLLPRLKQVEACLRRAVEPAGPPSLQTRCYVDTGPLVERVYAKYAGVGWIGKNTCVINQQLGSWLFLGVILTSLELAPDLPAPDRCGSCTRCLDACPTAALPQPYQLDATRCIAYLTIEKRGSIPEDLREGMGRHIFGCDICQDVCPWNAPRGVKPPATSLPEFQPRPELVNPSLAWLASLTQEEFRSAFRRSAVRRTKYSGLRRNLTIAIGNSRDSRFLPHLEALAHDPDPIVAEHARWALARTCRIT